MIRSLFALLLLSFLGCKSAIGPVSVAPRLYEIDEGVEARPRVPAEGKSSQVEEVERMIAPYKAQLDDKMNRVLAEVVTPLTKGTPESNLGNWMADIMYQAAKEYYPGKPIAFAATNIGGLRVSEIGTGPLIVSEIYELMPFDNQLVLLELKGSEVKEFVNHIANSGGWPVSEELHVSRSGEKLVVMVQGKALDPAATYYVATIDYVANGGSDSAMLRDKPQLGSGQYLRDILIDYAGRTTQPIDVKSSGNRMKL